MSIHGKCDKCGEVFYSIHHKETHICMPKKESYGTGTVTNQASKIDITEISHTATTIHNDMMGTIAKTFQGIPVRLDPELKGNQYYLCISQELLAEMEKQK